MTKIACIVQRYGTEVTGGAEAHARTLCERLAQACGWQVDVYTTTARDYTSWEPYYSPGQDQVGPCRVLRFAVQDRRHPLFFLLNRPTVGLCWLLRRAGLRRLAWVLEEQWLRWQGPVAPGLADALLAHQDEYAFVLFFTYLYATTQLLLPKLRAHAVLIPTAHDEAPFYFAHTRATLAAATKIFANTATEAALIARIHPGFAEKTLVVGLGADLEEAVIAQSLRQPLPHEIEQPYVLYCGRIGPSKDLDLLYRGMQAFWRAKPQSKLQLILCGALEADHRPPDDPRITYLGYVDEQTKLALVAQAACVASPSRLESMSMLALEALGLKTPLLLNQSCPVFREYAAEAASVTLFATPLDFAERLAAIIQGDVPGENALASSQNWAIHRFSWQNILSAYKEIATRRSEGSSL